ncbi:MAG TPA: PspC domain-containing protein [Candidatus Limnocylindria bacterium]|nr:PspC domain-containing protein [Candidatus Limnocylindria bacterium]
MKSRLERSATNRVIGGVCGGIAEYLAVDATLVRVVFVFTGFITAGLFILAYIVLLVLMPQPGQPAPFTSTPPPAATDTTARMGVDSAATTPAAVTPVDPAVHAAEAERRRMAFGYILIALGVVFLLSNAGVFRFVQWQFLWPLVIIGIGILFLVQRVRT